MVWGCVLGGTAVEMRLKGWRVFLELFDGVRRVRWTRGKVSVGKSLAMIPGSQVGYASCLMEKHWTGKRMGMEWDGVLGSMGMM